MKNKYYILGIESSCDDTAISIIDDEDNLLFDLRYSQTKTHEKFGGIVPEIASREHIKSIFKLIDKCKRDLPHVWEEIVAVAVTYKPGLIGSLLIGLEVGKTLAYIKKIPIIPIDHLKSHIYSVFLEKKIPFPFISLIISGGHTIFAKVDDFENIKLLGQTRDDAVGEAYDKVAKFLNLGYPGGPVIDKIYQEYDGTYIDLPFPLKNAPFEFSFSGLKTAVINLVRGKKLTEEFKKQIAASFQHKIIEIFSYRIKEVRKKYPNLPIVIGGGVSANKGLRKKLSRFKNLFFPSLKYATDNAAMVAGLGKWYFERKKNLIFPFQEDFFKLNAKARTDL